MTESVVFTEVGEAVSALDKERERLFRESQDVSKQQLACVERFAEEMRILGARQRKLGEKMVAVEHVMQKMLKPL